MRHYILGHIQIHHLAPTAIPILAKTFVIKNGTAIQAGKRLTAHDTSLNDIHWDQPSTSHLLTDKMPPIVRLYIPPPGTLTSCVTYTPPNKGGETRDGRQTPSPRVTRNRSLVWMACIALRMPRLPTMHHWRWMKSDARTNTGMILAESFERYWWFLGN